MVVTLVISNYKTHHVLIDNGSSADILYLPAFGQISIGRDKLKPVQWPLVRFIGDRLFSLGTIDLLVIAEEDEKQVTKVINFLVVDYPSAYNVILRRPALNQMKTTTSNYYLLMCFPTERGVGEVRGDRVTT